jgi:hypothetical protein
MDPQNNLQLRRVGLIAVSVFIFVGLVLPVIAGSATITDVTGDNESVTSWWSHDHTRIFDASREISAAPPSEEGRYVYKLSDLLFINVSGAADTIDDLGVVYETTDPNLKLGLDEDTGDYETVYNLRELQERHFQSFIKNTLSDSTEETAIRLDASPPSQNGAEYIKDAHVTLVEILGAAALNTDVSTGYATEDRITPQNSSVLAFGDFRVDYQEEVECTVSGNKRICTVEQLESMGMEEMNLTIVAQNGKYESPESDGFGNIIPYSADGLAGDSKFEVNAVAKTTVKNITRVYTRQNQSDDWSLESENEKLNTESLSVSNFVAGYLPGGVRVEQHIFDFQTHDKALSPDNVDPVIEESRQGRVILTGPGGGQITSFEDSLAGFLWSQMRFTSAESSQTTLENSWGVYSLASEATLTQLTETGQSPIDEVLMNAEMFITPVRERPDIPFTGAPLVPNHKTRIAGGGHQLTNVARPITAPNASHTVADFSFGESFKRSLVEATSVLGENIPVETYLYQLGRPTIEFHEVAGGEMRVRLVDYQNSSAEGGTPLSGRTLYLEGAERQTATTDNNGSVIVSPTLTDLTVRFEGVAPSTFNDEQFQTIREDLENSDTRIVEKYYQPIVATHDTGGQTDPIQVPGFGLFNSAIIPIAAIVLFLFLFIWLSRT